MTLLYLRITLDSTGRSLDEFDAYQEELKQLGIEELLDIYQRGYEPYIDSVFN